MDDGLSVDIEFLLNNPQLVQDAAAAESTMQGIADGMQAQAQAASDAITTMSANTIEGLKLQAAQYKAIADLTPLSNTAKISQYNQLVAETTTEIARLSSIGKDGFDALGNALPFEQTSKFSSALSKSTDLDNLAAMGAQQFTRSLLRMGAQFLLVGVIFQAATWLFDWIKNLDVFTGRLDQNKQNMAALNDVMKEADKVAGTQIGSLEVLYKTATDVNLSTQERIQAAKDLKATYPEAFANSSLMAIMNGQESKSYQQLTLDIYAAARAKAAQGKIDKLVSEQLDAQWQIDQNNRNKASELKGVDVNSLAPGGGGGRGGLVNQVSQQTLGQVIKQQTDEANLEPAQTIKRAQGQIDFLIPFAGDVTKAAAAIKSANDILGPNLQNFNKLISGVSDKADLDNIKNALDEKLKNIAPSDSQIKSIQDKIRQVEEIEKAYQPKTSDGKSQQQEGQTLLASQTSELEKIDALKQKYAAKEGTRDEQAMEAVKASYKQQADAIDALNKKYDNYVAKYGAAAAKAAGLQRIDPSVLTSSETDALAGLSGQQSLQQTKDQITQQKALFADYEAFKLKAGTDAANELYGNELHGYTSYLDYLKSLQPTEAQLTSADPYTKAKASAQSDYLKTVIPQAQAEETSRQAKHLQDLVVQGQDYEQRRQVLIEKANDDIKALVAAGYEDQTGIVAAQLQAQLAVEDAAQAQKIQAAKNITVAILNETKEQATIQLNALNAANEQSLAKGDISVAHYKTVADSINKALASINLNVLVNELGLVGSALTTIGGDISKTNANFGALVSGIGSVLTGMQSLYDLATKIQAAGGILQDPKDAISAISTGIQGIIGLVDNLTSAAAARKQAETDYYNSVIAYQTQYNELLITQQQLQYQTDANIFLQNNVEELNDAAAALKAANASEAQSIAALSAGQAIVAQKNVISGQNIAKGATSGAEIGGAAGAVLAGPIGAVVGAVGGAVIGAITGLFATKSANVLTPLLQQYPSLVQTINGVQTLNVAQAQALLQNNQVTASTKVLIQTALDYQKEQVAALAQIQSALQSMVGSLGSDLDNALVTAFENGTSAAEAFGNTVSNVIGNMVQQFLFQDIFGASFDALNAKLKADAGGTPAQITADVVAGVSSMKPLIGEFDAGMTALQQAGTAEGLTLFAPSSTTSTGVSSTTLTGQIGGMTVNQASELDGAINGLRLSVLEMTADITGMGQSMQDSLTELRTQTIVQMQIAANTLRSANNSDTMVTSLKSIDSNTSSSSLTNVLRAAGKV
jgi:hypothetical protein